MKSLPYKRFSPTLILKRLALFKLFPHRGASPYSFARPHIFTSLHRRPLSTLPISASNGMKILYIQSQIAMIDKKIDEIEHDIRMCNVNIDEGGASIRVLDKKYIDNEAKLVDVGVKLQQIDTIIGDEYKNLSSVSADEKNEWSGKKEIADKEKAELKERMAKLETEKAMLMTEKAALMTEKAALRTEKADLRTERARLEIERTELMKKEEEKIVRIPENIEFCKSIEQCTVLPSNSYAPRHLVGVSSVVSRCAQIVRENIFLQTFDLSRKPPLGLSRMGRGGKTTVLIHLFHHLKDSAKFNVVYINFNGKFEMKVGETHCEAILRLIAMQLVDTDLLNLDSRVVCSRDYLERYIVKSGRPFVLIIDELNSLAYPPDTDAARLLRDMFLNPPGRYLVFSTHRYITVEDTVNVLGVVSEPPSARQLTLVELAVSFDLDELRKISLSCRDLTMEQALYYGGIPSLIYCSREISAERNPADQFSRKVNVSDMNGVDKNTFIGGLIDHILSGDYLIAPDYVKYFESFASILNDVKSSTVTIRWPLVYIGRMLDFMYRVSPQSGEFKVLSDLQRLLDVDFVGHSSRVDSGTGWEIITIVAILLRCVRAYAMKETLTVMSINFGTVSSVSLNRLNDVKTIESAAAVITETMEPLSVGAVVMFYPSYAGFPFCDAILVYKTSSASLQQVAIQNKLGRSYREGDVPEWITKAVLIQGNAPKSRKKKKTTTKWLFLTREKVDELLGYSLMPLNPSNWNIPRR